MRVSLIPIWSTERHFLAHEEYKFCNLNEEQVVLTVRETAIVGHILWHPPPIGVIKVNWDAAFNKKKGCIGIVIIVRDCYGFFFFFFFFWVRVFFNNGKG
jgi:hypothetical protein